MGNSGTEGYTTHDPSGNAAITGLGSSTYYAYNGYTAPGGYSNPVTYNFTGQYGAYADKETGLVLMGFRYYDPGTGRFLAGNTIGSRGFPLLSSATSKLIAPPLPAASRCRRT